MRDSFPIPSQGSGRGSNRIPIRCVETGEEFDSISEAAVHYRISQSAISHHLLGRIYEISGYTFEYQDPDLERTRRHAPPPPRQYRVQILLEETGAVYSSIKEAARLIGLTEYVIRHRLQGGTRYATDHTFRKI